MLRFVVSGYLSLFEVFVVAGDLSVFEVFVVAGDLSVFEVFVVARDLSVFEAFVVAGSLALLHDGRSVIGSVVASEELTLKHFIWFKARQASWWFFVARCEASGRRYGCNMLRGLCLDERHCLVMIVLNLLLGN